MSTQFNSDYYLRGAEVGVSNYTNYRWMPRQTRALANAIVDHIGAEGCDTVLDFGCARGYLVRAMLEIGVEARGFDISEWAIKHCDPKVVGRVWSSWSRMTSRRYEHVVSKDTLEHIPQTDLPSTVSTLIDSARKTLFVVVPLCRRDGGPYIRVEDNMDKTHVTRWTLPSWLDLFTSMVGSSAKAEASWHVPGIKPSSHTHLGSCGFITVRK